MYRRSFVATVGSLPAGMLAGCLDEESEPEPQIAYLELENHRRDESYEFYVRIEEDGETVFEATEELAPADPSEGAVVFEDPVTGPGDYEVFVAVDEYDASVGTKQLISEEEDCLYLDFYLGAATLHFEYLTWPCEADSAD